MRMVAIGTMAEGGTTIVHPRFDAAAVLEAIATHRVTQLSYQASKGALVNLTRALAVEWAARGIRVNAVAPTWVSTELTRELIADPLTLARMLDLTPMRRLPEPSDVASAIVFLASGGARMITGHTLPVDGGYLAQ